MSRRRWIAAAVVLGVVAAMLAGLLVPTHRPEQVTLFWWWHWEAPLWAILALSLALGSAVGALLVGVFWYRELQRRLRADQRSREIDAEVNALRRLLARPDPKTPPDTKTTLTDGEPS